MKGKDGAVCVLLRRRSDARDPSCRVSLQPLTALWCLPPGSPEHPWVRKAVSLWVGDRPVLGGRPCAAERLLQDDAAGLAGRVLGFRAAGEDSSWVRRVRPADGGDGPEGQAVVVRAGRAVPAASCLRCHVRLGGDGAGGPAPPPLRV